MAHNSIPLWKLKREIHTLWTQLSFPFELLSMSARRWLYDRNSHKVIKHSLGSQPLSKNVGIVLIFQPNGVCKSVFETLRYLNDNGYSPFVISNAKLSDSDLEKLRANAFHVLERPNLGYDFGGYREGILHLLNSNIWPENLILLNDSVWFPVRKNCNFLTQVKEQSADLFGIVYSEKPGSPNRAHLQSYFYNFKGNLIRDPAFRKFWEKLFFSQNRLWVIKKCEMKLTQYFGIRGFSIDWLCDRKDLDKALISLSKEDIKMIAKFQLEVDMKNCAVLENVIRSELSKNNWRNEIRKFIESGVFGKSILVAHPEILLKLIKLPVLKKDKQEIYRAQRKEISNCGLDSLITKIVRDEIFEEQNMMTK
ncbi:MAG: hypothetical protein JKY94_14505 [Rhodobacteraceae bacterium]|nr:hypothetical protein [Paracoccaceae bacterium]